MRATLIEVAPRDGFQPIGPFIPTDDKVSFVEAAHAAGLRRIEIGSFVNPAAVPQLRDTAEVLRRTAHLDRLDAQVLVPNARGVALALEAGRGTWPMWSPPPRRITAPTSGATSRPPSVTTARS
ncbi:hypothetical protein ACFQU7_38865 [Pseudoroseomonas wenyumeiae]